MTAVRLPPRRPSPVEAELYGIPAVRADQRFEVWVEGHTGTNPDQAKFLGAILAPDFDTACARVLTREYHVKSVLAYFDAKQLTMWGDKLFNNEADARKRNG